MKESEKLIERKLVHNVEKKGGMCIKLLSKHLVGLPDRLCILPDGRIFFAELKSTGDKPRAIQLYRHKQIKDLGFEVFIVDKKEQIDELC